MMQSIALIIIGLLCCFLAWKTCKTYMELIEVRRWDKLNREDVARLRKSNGNLARENEKLRESLRQSVAQAAA